MNTNRLVPTLLKLPCLFLVSITREAYLHHHLRSVNADAYLLTLEHHELGIKSKSVATAVGQ